MTKPFKVPLSHVICLAAGFAAAAFVLPLRSGSTQARVLVARELTSGSAAGPSPVLEARPIESEANSRGRAQKAAPQPVPTVSNPDAPEESVMHRALRTAAAIRVGPAYGAGVLVSEDGLVLTVNHVIESHEEGSHPVRVSVAGLPWRDAEIVARDPVTDLALVRVHLPEGGPQRAARLTSATNCRAGDGVFTIGSPASMHFSLARGAVSFVGRRFGGFRYLQTDIPTQPGNSGGALFNGDGEVVGLMTFILRNGQNLAFAIPVDYARTKFPELGAATAGVDSTFTAWAEAKVESPL